MAQRPYVRAALRPASLAPALSSPLSIRPESPLSPFPFVLSRFLQVRGQYGASQAQGCVALNVIPSRSLSLPRSPFTPIHLPCVVFINNLSYFASQRTQDGRGNSPVAVPLFFRWLLLVFFVFHCSVCSVCFVWSVILTNFSSPSTGTSALGSRMAAGREQQRREIQRVPTTNSHVPNAAAQQAAQQHAAQQRVLASRQATTGTNASGIGRIIPRTLEYRSFFTFFHDRSLLTFFHGTLATYLCH